MLRELTEEQIWLRFAPSFSQVLSLSSLPIDRSERDSFPTMSTVCMKGGEGGPERRKGRPGLTGRESNNILSLYGYCWIRLDFAIK